MSTESRPSITEGHDFRMGGWVSQLDNAAGALRYYLAVDHDDRPERRLALILERSAGYLYRFFQKMLIDVTERRGHWYFVSLMSAD